MCIFPPMRWGTKALHPSAPGPALLSNVRTHCGPRIKKFAHPCSTCFMQQRDSLNVAIKFVFLDRIYPRFHLLLDMISELSTYGELSSDSIEAHVDGVLKVRRGGDLGPVLVTVFLPSSCERGQRSARSSAAATSGLKARHCSHLFQRQRWRWSCSWTFFPRARTAGGENCDWPTASPWDLLLGCSSWPGGRGACPHTERCHTSTQVCTCTNDKETCTVGGWLMLTSAEKRQTEKRVAWSPARHDNWVRIRWMENHLNSK